ncbi:RNB domain-containing ribonuclease [Nocardioides sambongensis]|uniref:RNB domain-containing ribonuclease n=1 Tax=Nocardioides sambongensis TaxID=2589074 RepID=UPI001129C33D|nr:RNB domain-containing ribonuclease [Nocardioides sambongensis]
MPSNVAVRVRARSEVLTDGLRRIREELELPGEFPGEVTAAAEEALRAVVLPARDATDLPLITIDPEGSMDLDQALHLTRTGAGFRVHYAIADVAAFVPAGGPVDAEARTRGETLYGAGDRIPLHPPALSEGGASLLPEQVRPALLWTIDLDADGATAAVHVERAAVRSRERWSYAAAQRAVDTGQAPEVLGLLREIGRLLIAQEAARGGVSLPLPEQEVEEDDRGHFTLTFRDPLPVEEWNAQISLLTGMAAAQLMLQAGVGLLRTLPPADPRDVARLRRVAAGLGIDWPDDVAYPDFVRRLDPSQPAHQAMTVACTRLLRGSGHAAFDGAPPDQPLHAAIAAPYAHVTAPLRRLGDRFAGEVCLAACAGTEVPPWVREALPTLPELLADSARRAGAYERAVLDLIEAGTLVGRVGEEFTGVITSVEEERPERGVVLVTAIGVEARVTSERPLPLGTEVTVRLAEADPATRKVLFTR